MPLSLVLFSFGSLRNSQRSLQELMLTKSAQAKEPRIYLTLKELAELLK